MREFQKRRKLKERLYSIPVLLVLLVLLFVALNGAWNMYGKYASNSAELSRMRAEAADMRERREELTGKLRYLETDKGVEEEIRNKYNVVKEGEEVVVIVDDRASTSPESRSEKGGFFANIWSSITGIFGD